MLLEYHLCPGIAYAPLPPLSPTLKYIFISSMFVKQVTVCVCMHVHTCTLNHKQNLLIYCLLPLTITQKFMQTEMFLSFFFSLIWYPAYRRNFPEWINFSNHGWEICFIKANLLVLLWGEVTLKERKN